MAAPEPALRPETDEDEPFLQRLFTAVRGGEFAMMPLEPAQIEAMLAMQFRAQRMHYRAVFPDADCSIVEVAGAPVGRLYVAREGAALRIVDVALLPEWSGQGIGGALIDGVLAAGKPVLLAVRPENPARRLYQRKGFVEAGIEGADVAMAWRPPVS